MGSARHVLIAVALAALLLGGAGVARAQGSSTVTGTLSYRERVALPENSIVVVQIADVTTPGRPGVVVAQQRFSTGRNQVPFRFRISYNPSRIDPNRLYSVQANISVAGEVRFSTASQYRVITGGAPVSDLEVQLIQVGALPPTSGGALPLLAGLAALGLLALVRLARLGLRRAPGGLAGRP